MKSRIQQLLILVVPIIIISSAFLMKNIELKKEIGEQYQREISISYTNFYRENIKRNLIS